MNGKIVLSHKDKSGNRYYYVFPKDLIGIESSMHHTNILFNGKEYEVDQSLQEITSLLWD